MLPAELNLSRNINLTELRLTLHIPAVLEDHTLVHPCTWLYTLLTTVRSKELAYLTIEWDVRDLDPGADPRAALDTIALLLTSKVASFIDVLLAVGKRFQNLKSVYLGVFCARQGMLVDEEAWADVTRARFPALSARRMLQ